MSAIVPHARLRADLDLLSDLVSGLGFGLETPGRADRVHMRAHLLGITRRYLEPRLADPGHPLLVAVFGPTGSGKSTLVNTLVGREISPTGVLRPTTTQAVVWVHHRHAEAVRLMLGPEVALVEDEHPVLGSLALVDTPDIDSVATDHRRQTVEILEAADVALAVTTPQRYADAVPWDVLGELTARALEVTVVVNRASRRSSGAVIDLVGLLRDAHVRGVDSADDVVVIQEQRIRSDGRLHGYALRRLARRLQDLAASRSVVAAAGIRGAVHHCVAGCRELAAEVEEQAAEAGRLRSVLDDAVETARTDIEVGLEQGDLVRDEVVARWQRLVGVSDLAEGVSRILGRLRTLAVGSADPDDALVQVDREVTDELADLGLRRAVRTLTAIEIAWSSSAAGRRLLEDVAVDRESMRRSFEEAIASWRSDLIDMVAETADGRAKRTRLATYGVNGIATLVLLTVFGTTGGLTGAEVGVAAGAAAAQQALLERLLGSAEVRRLERQVRQGLADRIGEQISQAIEPHRRVLFASVDDVDAADELRDAARRVAIAFAEYDDV